MNDWPTSDSALRATSLAKRMSQEFAAKFLSLVGGRQRAEQLRSLGQWGRERLRRLAQVPLRQRLSLLLLASGALLSLYVSGTYLWMFHQQRVLMREWQIQNVASAYPNTSQTSLVRLLIPRINIDAVILDDTSHRSLTLGPGHLRNSALPGDTGNAVIAAHRDTFFRNVPELVPGDDIFIERDGRKFHYVVSGRRIVQPDDLSVLEPTSDSTLTLITCYPTYYVGPAPKRLVVFARLAGHA